MSIPITCGIPSLSPTFTCKFSRIFMWLPNSSYCAIQTREPHVLQTATAPSYGASLRGRVTLTNEEATKSLIQRRFKSD